MSVWSVCVRRCVVYMCVYEYRESVYVDVCVQKQSVMARRSQERHSLVPTVQAKPNHTHSTHSYTATLPHCILPVSASKQAPTSHSLMQLSLPLRPQCTNTGATVYHMPDTPHLNPNRYLFHYFLQYGHTCSLPSRVLWMVTH